MAPFDREIRVSPKSEGYKDRVIYIKGLTQIVLLVGNFQALGGRSYPQFP